MLGLYTFQDTNLVAKVLDTLSWISLAMKLHFDLHMLSLDRSARETNSINCSFLQEVLSFLQ